MYNDTENNTKVLPFMGRGLNLPDVPFNFTGINFTIFNSPSGVGVFNLCSAQ